MSARSISKQQPFMPLFFGDFLAATSEWEGIERSLYLTLLAYQWSQGSLPNDLRKLAKLVDWDRELFETCWRQVGQKFLKGGERLYNARLEQHRAKAKEISAKNAAAGKKGAAAKWRKDGERHREDLANVTGTDGARHEDNVANASGMNGERHSSAIDSPMAPSYGNPNHTNPSHPIQSRTSHPAGTREAQPRAETDPDRVREAFELVQANYPVGTYRDNTWLIAERNFARLINDGVATAAELVEAATAYRDQKQAEEKIGTQFVLSPANFLDPEQKNWCGPFPIPRSKAQRQQDSNIAAGQEWLRRNGAASDG